MPHLSKLVLSALLLFVGASLAPFVGASLAQAQVVDPFAAALQSADAVGSELQATTGSDLGNRLYGVSTQLLTNGSVETRVLVRDADRVQDRRFACTAAGTSSQASPICSATSQSEFVDQAVGQVFDLNAFRAALADAARQYARRIGSVEQVRTLATWQWADEIFVSIDYTSTQGLNATVHYHCHVHGAGGAIDCHRARSEGEQRPRN